MISKENIDVESLVSRTPGAPASPTPGASSTDGTSTARVEATVTPVAVRIDKFKSFYGERIRLPKSENLSKWMKWAYMLACLVSVCVDPFFFYIPIVRKDSKCISLHQSVKITTITLRSTLDLLCLAYVILIAYQKYLLRRPTSQPITNWERTKRLINWLLHNWMVVLLTFFALLPIPQIIFIQKLLDFSSSGRTKLLSFLALMQYVPRVLRIYSSSREFNRGFSFFLYILSGHAIGSSWYFLAIQREATCWKDACRSESSCEPTSFTTFCVDDPRTRNTTFLNDSCSLDEGKAISFHFGMFRDAARDGVLESTNLWKKFSYCLWWGLRNLSSLAQNLSPSMYTWQNIYAIFIAICGLLPASLYLTSNLKPWMQLVDRSSTEKRVIRQLTVKDQEVQLWLKEHDLLNEIMDDVQRQLEQKLDVHVKNILHIPPVLKRHLYMSSLKDVEVFRMLPEDVMEALLEILKPVNYDMNIDIFREGRPLVMMLLITEGSMLTYPSNDAGTSSGSSNKYLQKGDVFGQELAIWAAMSSPFSHLPVSTRNATSISKVEALALTACDLKNVLDRFNQGPVQL